MTFYKKSFIAVLIFSFLCLTHVISTNNFSYNLDDYINSYCYSKIKQYVKIERPKTIDFAKFAIRELVTFETYDAVIDQYYKSFDGYLNSENVMVPEDFCNSYVDANKAAYKTKKDLKETIEKVSGENSSNNVASKPTRPNIAYAENSVYPSTSRSIREKRKKTQMDIEGVKKNCTRKLKALFGETSDKALHHAFFNTRAPNKDEVDDEISDAESIVSDHESESEQEISEVSEDETDSSEYNSNKTVEQNVSSQNFIYGKNRYKDSSKDTKYSNICSVCKKTVCKTHGVQVSKCVNCMDTE